MSDLDPALRPGWREGFLDTNGIRLHVVEAGPRDGPLVILLHGFPEFWYGWRHQIEPLARAGFRVLVPDQRGYHLSDKPPRLKDYKLDVLTRDAVGLIDALGRRQAHLVAHDWGGAVAWMASMLYPQRVARMAVLNLPHPLVMRRYLFTRPRQTLRSWYIFFFQLPWLPEWVLTRRDGAAAVGVLRATSRPGTFGEEELAHYRRAWRQPCAMLSMIRWYRAALQRPPRRPDDLRVSVPVRLLWGVHDVVLGREMVPPSARLCDDVEVIYLDAAGHFLQHEEPEEVNRLLVEFLSA